MYTMRTYVQAESPEQAAALLRENRRNVILGGNMWLRMGSRMIHTGIDLCRLGLDQIKSEEGGVSIGAMATLAQFRDDPEVARITHGAARRCVSPIVGTQFQNMATVGGSLYARFGFSDVDTLLLALDATADFVLAGRRTVEDFLANGPEKGGDVLTAIHLRDGWEKAAFEDFRNTSTDLSVLNCACAAGNGEFRVAVGARPGRAVLCAPAAEAWRAGKSPEEIKKEKEQTWEAMSLTEHMDVYLSQGIEKKEAMKLVAKDRGIGKRDVYQMLLEEQE